MQRKKKQSSYEAVGAKCFAKNCQDRDIFEKWHKLPVAKWWWPVEMMGLQKCAVSNLPPLTGPWLSIHTLLGNLIAFLLSRALSKRYYYVLHKTDHHYIHLKINKLRLRKNDFFKGKPRSLLFIQEQDNSSMRVTHNNEATRREFCSRCPL